MNVSNADLFERLVIVPARGGYDTNRRGNTWEVKLSETQCQKCATPMRQVQRLTIDGRDIREFECPACAFKTRLDFGPAVWLNLLSSEPDPDEEWDSTLSAEPQGVEESSVELIPNPAKVKQAPAPIQALTDTPPNVTAPAEAAGDPAEPVPPPGKSSSGGGKQRGRSSRSPRKSHTSLPRAGVLPNADSSETQDADAAASPSGKISSDTISLLIGLDAAAAKQDDAPEEAIGSGIPSFAKGRRPGKKGRLSRVPRSLKVNELVSDVLSDAFVEWDNDRPQTLEEIQSRTYMEQGELFARAGDHNRAIDAFTKAIEEQPYHADAYAMRSVALFALRSYYEAIEDASRAVHLDPNLAAAYACRANCQKMLGRPDLALRDLERARKARLQGLVDACTRMICENGFDWKAYDDRAKIFEQMGENELARDDRERSLTIRSKMWEGQRRPDAMPIFNLSDPAESFSTTSDTSAVQSPQGALEAAPSPVPLSESTAPSTAAADPAEEAASDSFAGSQESLPTPAAAEETTAQESAFIADSQEPGPDSDLPPAPDLVSEPPAAPAADVEECPETTPVDQEAEQLTTPPDVNEAEGSPESSLVAKLKHADAFESMRQIWLESKGKKNKPAKEGDVLSDDTSAS